MISSIQDARAHSAIYYYTGRPCKYGHFSPRFTANRACVICDAIGKRLATPDQRERRRALQKKYDEKRKARKRRAAKKSYEKRKEIVTLRQQANPNFSRTRRAASRQYRSALRKGMVWRDQIDIQDRIDQIYEKAKRLRREGHDMVVDHIIPISNDLVCGLHVPWNMQILTRVENSAKNNKFDPADFEWSKKSRQKAAKEEEESMNSPPECPKTA